ncbi:MAG: LysR family transcriptional regulator [Archangium gephyra]|uniref:LysR family transcriptional regulator n=1 Tax=Archangium gephyra TaxID=48 RepID=A0A2W5T7G7_9BACT|nr:MAG: LysR family transcriptional regulator [Archangium gephyra]
MSQTVRRLEDSLGFPLLQRTTRSVRTTEAGERLLAGVAPAIAELGVALDAAGDLRGTPSGRLRLAVSSIAETFLSGPLLAEFGVRFPDVQLDVTVTDEEFDIVAHGYDAGVRLGELIERDMVTVPVSGAQRQFAFASPKYLKKFGAPKHPRELVNHRCIGWRRAADVAPYRWEFGRNGRDFDVAVDPAVTTNDMWLMIRLAVAGGGITFGMEDTFQPWLTSGALVRLLEAYSPKFDGFHLYFPSRKNMPLKLRALVDFLKERRR